MNDILFNGIEIYTSRREVVHVQWEMDYYDVNSICHVLGEWTFDSYTHPDLIGNVEYRLCVI